MANQYSLERKKILITGASGSIGGMIARQCSQSGAEVLATGRSSEKLREIYETITQDSSSICRIFEADLCKDEDIIELASKIESLDGVVLCAGRNDKSLLKFITRGKIEEIFNTNVFSEILLCKELVKRKKLRKGCSIVFISSISSVYATISNTLYAATKGAINSIIRVLALEMSSNRIRVNGIMPGMIKSPMMNAYGLSEEELQNIENQYPMGRLGETSDIANGAVFLLSEASSWITGQNLVIDGGLTLR